MCGAKVRKLTDLLFKRCKIYTFLVRNWRPDVISETELAEVGFEGVY
jgi:hypothetical protein